MTNRNILKEFERKYAPATIARHAAAIEAGFAVRIARRYAPLPTPVKIVREIQSALAEQGELCGCGKPYGTCDGNSPYCG